MSSPIDRACAVILLVLALTWPLWIRPLCVLVLKAGGAL